MSILIEGMEMPEKCDYCPFYDDSVYGDCTITHKMVDYATKPDDCPLIAVTPHGRLIDADALIDYCKHFAEVFKNSSLPTDKARRDELLGVIGEIVNAPTIIPAEEGEK